MTNPAGSYRSSVAMLVLTLFVAGCGYGPVSKRGYEIATALHSAIARQDTEAIARIAEAIKRDSDGGQLAGDEAAWLGEIVAEASAEDWKEAERAARKLLQDQADL